MKKQMKKGLIPSLLTVAMVLSGCNNVLYDTNNTAPVFSGTQAKRNGGATPPALINSTFTPLPSNGSAGTGSIERPGNIQNTQNNPYNNTTATQQPTVKVEPLPPQRPAVARPSTTIKSSTAQPPAKIVSSATPTPETVAAVNSDPRIREASDVLANKTQQAQNATNNTVDNAASRVTQPMTKATDSVKSTAQTVADEADKTAEEAAQSVPKKTASATTALLQEARDAVGAGNYDKAASALERAHRIEPSNAKILYDIAQIRYAQGKYSQAESFASKAASLSKSSGLSKKTWSLLSNSRKALGNKIGAETAAKKAASF